MSLTSAKQVGIVFDLDNTLVASSIDFAGMRRSVLETLANAGLKISDEQSHWPVGRLAELASEPSLPTCLSQHVWKCVEEYEVAGMHAAVLEAGAEEVLSELSKRGHPLAVLTNNSRASALDVLNRNNLTHFFKAVLCRDDVTKLKPAPDGVAAAQTLIGNPPHLIVVGDSWIDGVAANGAGARFIAVGEWRVEPQPCEVWAKVATLYGILDLDLVR